MRLTAEQLRWIAHQVEFINTAPRLGSDNGYVELGRATDTTIGWLVRDPEDPEWTFTPDDPRTPKEES